MLWMIPLAALLLYLTWKMFLEEEDNPLDQLPGPPRKPIIGSVLEFLKADKRVLFVKMRDYASAYGDRYLVKIFKRRILHLTNVKDVEVVLSHSKNITKSRPYSFLQDWLGTGLLLSTGSKWHRRRKVLTPAFHFNILKNFSQVIEEKSRDMVNRLKQHESVEVDLMPVVSDFTLFTICETAMGTQLDSDKSNATVEYKNAILEIGYLVFYRLTRVWLHNDFIFRRFPIGKKFDNCLKRVHSFADNVIMDRKNKRTLNGEKGTFVKEDENLGCKKRLAMLDLLLEAEEMGEIDLEGIREEVNTFMFEGHDTTAVAITFAIMLIADHEEIQERIHEELHQIFGESSRAAGAADLAAMRYLEAALKETLRLYPSVPFIARTVTEDFMLDNLPVRKGCEVAVHIYDLHRRADLYPDPESFRPERFLSGKIIHPYAFVPFSAGPRNCIGQRFAMLEMKCVVSEVCRWFRLEPRVRGRRPTLVADMLLRPAEPIYVNFIRRK